MSAEAFIGGLASLGLQAHSQNAADERADLSFQRQKELMALQNQYAVQNWERENNYNHPKEQMKRLKAAGLNPDIMYGNGAAGLQAGSIDSPGAPASPMAPTMDFSKSVNDAVSAAVGMEQAKKTKSETLEQDIRNKYIEREVQATLRSLDDAHNLSVEQKEQIVQSVKESQANIDALKARVGNETYDRILSTFTTAGQLEKWRHENDLNDEQKKWIGTHAMAALIGARGSAAQANAMAQAISMFRNPEVLRDTIKAYFDVVKEELGNLINNTEVVKAYNSLKSAVESGFDKFFGSEEDNIRKKVKPSGGVR